MASKLFEWEEGDPCPVCGTGKIVLGHVGEGCYCRHTKPPCGWCTDSFPVCDNNECEYEIGT